MAGIPTAALEGGAGPPLVLLHGPGESAAKWLRLIPGLVERHTVIAPDLPAHGASGGADLRLDAGRVGAWMEALVEETCQEAPVLLGHVLGGAIAARFAARHSDRLRHLVLVDALGLARFRPAARFLLSMMAFNLRPTERSYDRFMRQCSYDLEGLREELGDRWEPFAAYNIALTRAPSAKAVGRMLREIGMRRIAPTDLARITVPTTLIWGRHDRALPVRIAEAASARYGWPLHVIENCADDPPRDQPEAFLEVLTKTLTRGDLRHDAGA